MTFLVKNRNKKVTEEGLKLESETEQITVCVKPFYHVYSSSSALELHLHLAVHTSPVDCINITINFN